MHFRHPLYQKHDWALIQIGLSLITLHGLLTRAHNLPADGTASSPSLTMGWIC